MALRRHLSAVCLAAIVLSMCAVPVPYAVERPGPTLDVLGEAADGRPVLDVKGAATHGDTGRLLMVTVNAEGVPGSFVTGAEVAAAWVDPHAKAVPREALFPTGQTREEYDKETKDEMSGSQSSASDAALAFLRGRGVDVDGVTVDMDAGKIGGPSAGMMYALGVIDRLTEGNLTGGLTVAGTGTIDKDGKVGVIGGVDLKMIAARRDGATWFLAPETNCPDVVGNVPDGLRDVSVSTIGQAYDALVAIGSGKGDSLPHCMA